MYMSKRKALFTYVKDTYETEPDYLWPRTPGAAVLRHAETKKWYAVIMDVPAIRLGMDGDGEAAVVNVKNRPPIIRELRGRKGFLPAYHMNKIHWISILLDGSVPLEEVYEHIDASYALTKRK